jgi:ubiquinone/menaquinone biosynthesis C-methylase UbiE
MDDLLDLTSRVEATHFWFRGFRKFVAPAIGEIAGARRDLRLLDCGCGTGYNLASLLSPYGRAFGFDLTPGGLLHARSAGFPLARADMSHIPFQSSCFDIVTSFDVFQYVEDAGAAMQEMARVLKPGGGLVVTAAAFEVLRGGHAGTWPEVRRYTTRRMREIVEGAGLSVRRLTYLFASIFPAMLAVRLLRRDSASRDDGSPDGPETDWEMQVPPPLVNSGLTWMLSGEAAISRRLPMPVGSSVLVVAHKR